MRKQKLPDYIKKAPPKLQPLLLFFHYRKLLFYILISALLQTTILLAWHFPPPREDYFEITDTMQIIDIAAPAESSVDIQKDFEVSDEVTDKPVEENYDPRPLTEPTQSDFDTFLPERLLSTLPRPVGMPIKPAYPAAARQQQIEGTVIILAFFDSTGTLRKYKIMRSLGYGLDEAAIEAIKAQHFSPAYIDGKPVPARMYVQYSFILEDY